MRRAAIWAAILGFAALGEAAETPQITSWQELRWSQTPVWAVARPTPQYLRARLKWIIAGLRGKHIWDEAALLSQPYVCDPKSPLEETAARYGWQLGEYNLVAAVECLAHETGRWELCELFRRDPGYSIAAAICGTDVYGREFVRSFAAGRPDRRLCRAYLAATFDGMDHQGRDIAGRIDDAGWDRLCSALEADLKRGTLNVCKRVVAELAAVMSSSESVHLEMEYLRNVCQPDLGAFIQGDASCVATSNAFDQVQCRTNARTAAALKRGDGALCESDELCLVAVGKQTCSRQIASALETACPVKAGPGKPPDPPDAERAARAFRQEIRLLSEGARGLASDAELNALLAEVRSAAKAKGIPEPASELKP